MQRTITHILVLFFISALFLTPNSLLSIPVFASVYISEIYPAPKTGDKEWVEIYSSEESLIDLSNYRLEDLAGNKISTAGIILNPNNYVSVLSSNILNNSGDTMYLKNKENLIIDTVIYPSIESEKSYSFCPLQNQWVKNTLSSKEMANYDICVPYFITPTTTPTNTPVPTHTPIPTKTPTPTPTPIPTHTPTPLKTPTPIPSSTLTPNPTTPTSLTVTTIISPTKIINKYLNSQQLATNNQKLIVTIQDNPTPTLFPDEPVKKPDNLPGLWTFGFSLLNIFLVLNRMNK